MKNDLNSARNAENIYGKPEGTTRTAIILTAAVKVN